MMDLRKTLIELLLTEPWTIQARGNSKRLAAAGRVADHLIANGVTFATDNHVGGKWIPVTERLPEVYEKDHNWSATVLFRTAQGHIHSGYRNIGKPQTSFYDDDWTPPYWLDESENLSFEEGEVTHWMPLPAPPDANAGCEEAVMDDPNAWFKEVSIAGCWPDEAEEMKRSHLFVQLSRYKKFVEPVKGEIGMLAGVRFFVKGGDSE